jgi:hypothetical protein
MGMLDSDHKALSSFEAYRDYDPSRPPIHDIDAYISNLYRTNIMSKVQAGDNLIPNGDFSRGLNGWWVKHYPDDVDVRCENGELYVSSKSIFTFELSREIGIIEEGDYRLMLDYRGTNTTGVDIKMFLTVINCNGEKTYTCSVYPTDIGFQTYVLDVHLKPCTVKAGLMMDSSPVYGRVSDIRLVEVG